MTPGGALLRAVISFCPMGGIYGSYVLLVVLETKLMLNGKYFHYSLSLRNPLNLEAISRDFTIRQSLVTTPFLSGMLISRHWKTACISCADLKTTRDTLHCF